MSTAGLDHQRYAYVCAIQGPGGQWLHVYQDRDVDRIQGEPWFTFLAKRFQAGRPLPRLPAWIQVFLTASA